MYLGQEDDAGHVATAGLDGAVHEGGQAGGETGGDGARGLHRGHAPLGLTVRQLGAGQAQRALVHGLPDQRHVNLLGVLANLRAHHTNCAPNLLLTFRRLFSRTRFYHSPHVQGWSLGTSADQTLRPSPRY